MGKILHFQKPINRSERKGKQKNQLLTVGLYIVFVDCCLLFFFFPYCCCCLEHFLFKNLFFCERCWRFSVKFQTVIFEESQLHFLIMSRKPLIFYLLTSALLFINCQFSFAVLCVSSALIFSESSEESLIQSIT